MSAQPGPGLAGLRVVECGQGVSAACATKMIADLGADVIKVEPPGGDLTRRRGPFPDDRVDPDKSGLFIYLNTNKRGVTADLATPEGRAFLRPPAGRRRHPDPQRRAGGTPCDGPRQPASCAPRIPG